MALPDLRFPLVLTASVFAPAARAQSPMQVSVTVYSPLLAPVPNATITLRWPDWTIFKEGKADGSGEFLFHPPASGWVYCCATAPGLTSGCGIASSPTGARPVIHLDIRLF